MKLILAREAVFPIVYDRDGKRLAEVPASGFDVAGTIQGEGKLNGIPSLFVRFAGCNLFCAWRTPEGEVCECDTAHASFRVTERVMMEPQEVFELIKSNCGAIRHVVITGGEPFLQPQGLRDLCRLLKENGGFHVTVETNASCFDAEAAGYIDFFSLSPKLASSIPPTDRAELHRQRRISVEAIQSFIGCAQSDGKDFQLKFVYACEEDVSEIENLLRILSGWQPEDILLMPLGSNAEQLRQSMRQALVHCIRHGWRFCDRLHITLFGSKQGV